MEVTQMTFAFAGSRKSTQKNLHSKDTIFKERQNYMKSKVVYSIRKMLHIG